MKNHIQDGHNLEVKAPYALLSGAGCLVGKIFGIAVKDALINAQVNIVRTGVFTLPSDTGTAYTAGDAIYWDNTNKRVTKTSASNQLIGAVVEDKLSAGTSVAVLLDGTIRP